MPDGAEKAAESMFLKFLNNFHRLYTNYRGVSNAKQHQSCLSNCKRETKDFQTVMYRQTILLSEFVKTEKLLNSTYTFSIIKREMKSKEKSRTVSEFPLRHKKGPRQMRQKNGLQFTVDGCR